MNNNKIYRSPLFYVGDKYKLYSEIANYFPILINNFIEPFTGGGSVFLNTKANNYLLNDIDNNVITIHHFLKSQANNSEIFFDNIFNILKKYNLSHSYITDIVPIDLKKMFPKTYYAKFNQLGFNNLKEHYNLEQTKKTIELYLLLIYGFNRMLRFNSKKQYNLPVGNVDFNKNTELALIDYFRLIKEKKTTFYNLDFLEFFKVVEFEKDDFVYLDPPYLITFSEYNKLWNNAQETKLIQFLESLNRKNIKFAISNVTHYKGKVNEQFLDWSKNYNCFSIKSNYISYHDNSNKEFKEVLVTNYPPEIIEVKQNLLF